MPRKRVSVSFRSALIAAPMLVVACLWTSPPARAISIELKDVASDRVDRQRKAAEGDLPLAGTPDLANFEGRLQSAGVTLGAPVVLRIFKAESELEVWMLKDGAYARFATYPICYWSGTLGPKTREGDRQAPEGFYSISKDLLHRGGRWPRSLNLGFPNVFDRAQARDGSYILVHGGCNSVGCFAMTNAVIKEIYDLTEAALNHGQSHVPVHVFPFRMTAGNMAEYPDHPWRDFWMNLKQGYDAFEETRLPPRVSVCGSRYYVEPVARGGSTLAGPLEVCGARVSAVELLDRWYKAAQLRPSSWWSKGLDRLRTRRDDLAAIKARRTATLVQEWATAAADDPDPLPIVRVSSRSNEAKAGKQAGLRCSLKRASCRKFAAMKRRMATKAANRKMRTASKSK